MLFPKISSLWSDSQTSLHNPLNHNGCKIGFQPAVWSTCRLQWQLIKEVSSKSHQKHRVVTCEDKWGGVTGWDSRESHYSPSGMFLWLHGYFVSEFLWFWVSNLGPCLWEINTLPLYPSTWPFEISVLFLKSFFFQSFWGLCIWQNKMCVRCIVRV